MSNFQKLIEIVTPFFEKEGFKKKRKTTFSKREAEAEYFFIIQSYQSGFSAMSTYGVYFERFNRVFCNVFTKRDFKETLFVTTESGFMETDYQRFILESEEDIKDSQLRLIELYENYSVPYFKSNSTLQGVLNTIRLEEGLHQVNGNKHNSLLPKQSIQLDLFLTKLLDEEGYERRVEHYLTLTQEAEENNIKEYGQGGAFTMYIQVVKDGKENIDKADWPKIRYELGL